MWLSSDYDHHITQQYVKTFQRFQHNVYVCVCVLVARMSKTFLLNLKDHLDSDSFYEHAEGWICVTVWLKKKKKFKLTVK